MGLQVQPLAGGVRGKENAQRVPSRRRIERLLDDLAVLGRRRAVEDRDAIVGLVRSLNRRY